MPSVLRFDVCSAVQQIGHRRADRSDSTVSWEAEKVRFAVGREMGTSPGKLVFDQRKT